MRSVLTSDASLPKSLIFSVCTSTYTSRQFSRKIEPEYGEFDTLDVDLHDCRFRQLAFFDYRVVSGSLDSESAFVIAGRGGVVIYIRLCLLIKQSIYVFKSRFLTKNIEYEWKKLGAN